MDIAPALVSRSAPQPPLELGGLNLVVGLGKSGLSMARTLMRLGARTAVVDSRSEPPGLVLLQREYPGLTCRLGEFNAETFAAADRILLSPGVSVQTPVIAEARQRGVPVWGDIELFARLVSAPVAAITGSNGKSTVTTLLGAMAERAGLDAGVGGNLGTPALDLLADGGKELYILELSSFQLETVSSLNAAVATVLNISADHLDRHRDLAEYGRIKQRIFHGDGWMVINADDRLVTPWVEPNRRVRRFTLAEPAAGEFGLRRQGGERYLAYGDECWLAVAELKISGDHNLANALAALAMGQALGLDRFAMLAALREFQGLPHRTELVGDRHGVRWFNDSKGTNVGATVAAVRGLPGRLVVIAGGEGKGQDFTPLRSALADKARALVLIGRDAPLLAAAVEGTVPVHWATDMVHAVTLAAGLARPGDCVLLSPACASFDMFSGYEERGAVFTEAVQRWALC